MKNDENIYDFLKSNGFKVFDKVISKSFGDYYQVFANESFELRFSSDKSYEAVDIRSCLPNEGWYDLALVKALLYNETNLNKVTYIEEYNAFLRKELACISELFSSRDYLITKNKLDKLGHERVKQMFPGMI